MTGQKVTSSTAAHDTMSCQEYFRRMANIRCVTETDTGSHSKWNKHENTVICESLLGFRWGQQVQSSSHDSLGCKTTALIISLWWSFPGLCVSYLQRSSWRSLRVLLWTAGRPMSPAGPHRCSWQVCPPSSPQPTAGAHTLAQRLASSQLAYLGHTHSQMKNYAAKPASSQWNCRSLELCIRLRGHLSLPSWSFPSCCPLSDI